MCCLHCIHSIELQHQSLDRAGYMKGAIAHLQRILLYGLLIVGLNGFLQILALVLDEYILACQLLESLACRFASIRRLWIVKWVSLVDVPNL